MHVHPAGLRSSSVVFYLDWFIGLSQSHCKKYLYDIALVLISMFDQDEHGEIEVVSCKRNSFGVGNKNTAQRKCFLVPTCIIRGKIHSSCYRQEVIKDR